MLSLKRNTEKLDLDKVEMKTCCLMKDLILKLKSQDRVEEIMGNELYLTKTSNHNMK